MRDILVKILSITLTLYMSFIIIFRQNYNEITWYLDAFMVSVFLIISVMEGKEKFKYNSIILLYGMFIIISIASSFWSVEFDAPMFRIPPMVLILINLFVIYNMVKDYDLLDNAFYGILIGTFINYLIMFHIVSVPFEIYMGTGYDNRAIGTLGNPNNLSTTMLISMIVSFIYLLENKKINKLFFYYNYINVILATYLVLLSVSKQGIILAGVLLSGYIMTMISNKKKWIQLLIIVSISIVIFMFFIDKNELLHTSDLIIERFNAFNSVVLHGEIGGSTGARKALIQFGLNVFQDEPLLGYGFNNFAAISPTGAWAENNYVELLVGVGLIGTLIYYSIYIVLLKKIFLMDNGSLKYLLYFFILIIFLMDMSSIVYGLKIKLFTILLIAIYAEENGKKDKRKFILNE